MDSSEQKLYNEAVEAARKITAAARVQRVARFPKVVDGVVAFREGDRRFKLGATTAIYIEIYLTEEAGGLDLDAALLDENHVRELIEVITS